MDSKRANLLGLYWILNGFTLSIVIILFMFERPEGFLHYSPGDWLDVTIIITAVFTGLILPVYFRENFVKNASEDKLWIWESVVIVLGWLTFGLALLSFLYQTGRGARIVSVLITIFALIYSYPRKS